ncbi:hypothetical protein O6H91_06G096500 [Diphasiastrum complanatum]|uniref:Uncharacterized protein n=1 Tax=Diphasiastrum complanatum TaxID=34168 RepID=A0ACC2DGZ3_DIPCM|nr:hypothetical protein O6H91_06G096500 [Diphasiastrum complanatum]
MVGLSQWLITWRLVLVRPEKSASSCQESKAGYSIQEGAVCVDACRKVCFPRVRGLCVGHNDVMVCDGQPVITHEERYSGGGIPLEMLLWGESPRAAVPVKWRNCKGWIANSATKNSPTEMVNISIAEKSRWIAGTQMVADLKFMPFRSKFVGPNPHHEAEKLIPALLLAQFHGVKGSLYWFGSSDPTMLSRWSTGMIDAFSSVLKVLFLKAPAANQPPICFEDAILFSGLTNGGYIPSQATNNWLRHTVLKYCNIPEKNAERPLAIAVVLNRPNSTRFITNKRDVEAALERELRVPVEHATCGLGDFCSQVKVVAEADFFLTPHGSHNINFLFARPGATLLEAFPFLYHIDWFHNNIHAARLQHHEIYGTWPIQDRMLSLRMWVYAFMYTWKTCFFTRQCMNYSKNQPIHVDIQQLRLLLVSLKASCRMIVPNSCCLLNTTSACY